MAQCWTILPLVAAALCFSASNAAPRATTVSTTTGKQTTPPTMRVEGEEQLCAVNATERNIQRAHKGCKYNSLI